MNVQELRDLLATYNPQAPVYVEAVLVDGKGEVIGVETKAVDDVAPGGGLYGYGAVLKS